MEEKGGGASVRLGREVGLLGCLGLIVGSMIGSGIFVSPGGVLEESGSVAASIIIWGLSGVVATLGALVYAEMGTAMPDAGGEYLYIRHCLGGTVGFLYAWTSILLTKPCSIAIIVKTCAQYAVQPFAAAIAANDPDTAAEKIMWAQLGVAAVVIIFLCTMNCCSVKWTSRMQMALTLIKLVPLGLVLIGGFYNMAIGRTGNLELGFTPLPGASAVTAGSISLAFFSGLWSFDGWNNLNFIAEEIKNPSRTLPLAIVIGLPFTAVVYVLANVSYLTLLTPIEVVESEAVGNEWASEFLIGLSDAPNVVRVAETYIPVLMAILVVLATLGAANGTLFGAARAAFAGAREGHLPEPLAMVHRSALTPIPALIAESILSMILVSLLDISVLINLYGFVAWTFYGLAFASFFILRYKHPDLERPFKVWLVVPAFSLLFAVYVVVAPVVVDPKLEYAYAVGFMAAGLLFYVPFVYFGLRIPGTPWLYRKTEDLLRLTLSDKEL